MTAEVILAYNDGASVPFALFDADWASHNKGTGRVEFFKNGRFVDVVTLTLTQRLLSVPVNF